MTPNEIHTAQAAAHEALQRLDAEILALAKHIVADGGGPLTLDERSTAHMLMGNMRNRLEQNMRNEAMRDLLTEARKVIETHVD